MQFAQILHYEIHEKTHTNYFCFKMLFLKLLFYLKNGIVVLKHGRNRLEKLLLHKTLLTKPKN